MAAIVKMEKRNFFGLHNAGLILRADMRGGCPALLFFSLQHGTKVSAGTEIRRGPDFNFFLRRKKKSQFCCIDL